MRLMGIDYGDARVGIALSELTPCAAEECGGKFVLEHYMELINEHMGTLSLFPVKCNAVEHGVGYDEVANWPQLLSKPVYIENNYALIQINRASVPENIQGTHGEELKRKGYLLRFFLRLHYEHIPE